MKSNLRIVLLEDSLADAELIARELLQDGFSFSLTRVQTEAEFRRELETAPPDLVLADHGLPEFDGFAALEIVRKLSPHLPFIFVSGSNSQQMVYEMYEEGATDYVFKRDIKDLEAAVRNALEPQPEIELAPPCEADLSSGSPESSATDFFPGLVIPFTGHLWLCPQCHQARDEWGQVVPIEDYCHHRIESLVIRRLCARCQL